MRHSVDTPVRTEEAKRADAVERLASLGSALVALSGGVDSTLVAALARRHIPGRVLAVTAVSSFHDPEELQQARKIARLLKLEHRAVEGPGAEDPDLRDNPPERCYLCKKKVYSALFRLAREERLDAVLDGVHGEDQEAERPGLAAARELGVLSPLLAAGLRKDEIRRWAADLDLPSAGRPASPCLATRFPHHTTLSVETLRRVAEAEQALGELLPGDLRVRVHGDIARIETGPDALERLMEPALRGRAVLILKNAGFGFVTLDLEGYRSGSMDVPVERERNS